MENNTNQQQENQQQNNQGNQNQKQNNQQQTQSPEIDYEKLSQIIAGKQSVAEESVLKGYFKKQGLSKEEMEQAISAFKQQKAANQPDIQAIQNQAAEARLEAQQAVIERDAMLLSGDLGIDLKTMPYILKMADTSQVIEENGNVNQEKLKEALNKVLEDVPQLKQKQDTQQSGFRQIGVGQNQNTQQSNSGQQEQKTVPTKRWNRWN